MNYDVMLLGVRSRSPTATGPSFTDRLFECTLLYSALFKDPCSEDRLLEEEKKKKSSFCSHTATVLRHGGIACSTPPPPPQKKKIKKNEQLTLTSLGKEHGGRVLTDGCFSNQKQPPVKQFPSLTPSLMTLSKNQKYRFLNCSAKISVKLDPCDLTGHRCETP